MIDMRKRFRGNKPISTGTELDKDGGSRYIDGVAGGMLYAWQKDPVVERREVHGADEDERVGREEMVPERFRDGSEGGAYLPPPGFDPSLGPSVVKKKESEREGGGWSWWKGS